MRIRDPEFDEAFRGGLAVEGKVWAAVIVLVLPCLELRGELCGGADAGPAVELVFVGPMAAFDLPVRFRGPGRDSRMRDAEIMEVPSELTAEFGAMIGLHSLDGHGQSPAHFLDERDPGLDRVVLVASAYVSGAIAAFLAV